MAPFTHLFDLGSLGLRPGQGRRLQLLAPLAPLELGGERYEPRPVQVPVQLEVSRMSGPGYALRLSFQAALQGPCMRCLGDAGPLLEVDAREVDVPGGGTAELDSPYVQNETLDLAAWAHDAFLLAVPVAVLCHEDCRGLCPICAANLNDAGPGHRHEPEPDSRWAKLRELKLE